MPGDAQMRLRSHSISYRIGAPILPFFEISLASTMAVNNHEARRPASSPAKLTVTEAPRDAMKTPPIESLSQVNLRLARVSASLDH
jgi:hypothetical protein